MNIVHRVFSKNEPAFKEALDAISFPYKYEENLVGRVVRFEVSEDHPAWPAIRDLIAQHDAFDWVETRYTSEEIRSAEWLTLGATSHRGYPQPEDDFAYVSATYDTTNHCSTCGIGGRQVKPFRLRSEPKAKRSQFIQLNWVFDEFFIRAEAKTVLLQERFTGFGLLSPVVHKSDRVVDSLWQLTIDEVLPPALEIEDLHPVTCEDNNEEGISGKSTYCGRVKYHSPQRGPIRLKRAAMRDAPDFVKTSEWFGSGGKAFRKFLVSRRAADVILEHKWRGIVMNPIELTD